MFRQLNYKETLNELKNNYHANGLNVGNKVWIQGIISTLSTKDNELFFYNPNETWEEINSKYDKIVYSAANMFSKEYLSLIKTVTQLFRKSKVPVYVIAVGVQANSYDEIDRLICDIGNEVVDFMDCIYSTGGEIACRGYFTKEFLDKIAINTSVATGCPSLYQNGRGLKITKNGCVKKVIFNGNAPFDYHQLKAFPESTYIDQDIFLGYKYDLTKYNEAKYLVNMFERVGRKRTRLFFEDRIQVFYDMPEWKKYIEHERFDFSLGSRIHGNIMSLLSGVPAVVFAIDSRTREMAELFNIPFIDSIDKYQNIEELFDNADYRIFNEKFSKLFDCFEGFLQKCDLVKQVNQDNIFWDRSMPLNNEIVEENRNRLKNYLLNANIAQKIYFSFASRFSQIVKTNENTQKAIEEKY